MSKNDFRFGIFLKIQSLRVQKWPLDGRDHSDIRELVSLILNHKTGPDDYYIAGSVSALNSGFHHNPHSLLNFS